MDLRVCSNYFSYCIISQVKNTHILMILDHELDLKVFSLTQTVFFFFTAIRGVCPLVAEQLNRCCQWTPGIKE